MSHVVEMEDGKVVTIPEMLESIERWENNLNSSIFAIRLNPNLTFFAEFLISQVQSGTP
jgi:hypothetical protein